VSERVDAIVVGMGVGGEEVAGQLATAGLRVVGIENRLVGGECPYWGCVPSKMMIRAADLLAEGRRIPGLAGTSSIAPDWAPVFSPLAPDELAIGLETVYEAYLVHYGRPRLFDPPDGDEAADDAGCDAAVAGFGGLRGCGDREGQSGHGGNGDDFQHGCPSVLSGGNAAQAQKFRLS